MIQKTAATVFSAEQFDAAILDLDGVITQTAKVHAVAWKAMFDEFLADRANHDEDTREFDIETDYPRYVDGKPRNDGVRDFLAARHIDIPFGEPQDTEDRDTICGLARRKNRLFLQKLHSEGVRAYGSSIEFIRALRAGNIGVAVVSSSRNCREVLQAARIEELFDVRVDGRDSEALGLTGKPAPDIFVEAARRLNCDPRRCIGIEDATAGVEAARAADLGLVIGVDRDDRAQALLEHGADTVISDLGELLHDSGPGQAGQLPSAFTYLRFSAPAEDRDTAMFLDYDGTLTPIVDNPDDARLSEPMRETLKRLSGRCRLAVISGRDLIDVRQLIGIDGLWYAGSHGFDIAGPGGERQQHQAGLEYLPVLDSAEQQLRRQLEGIHGARIERKRFAITVHYRHVAASDLTDLRERIEAVQGEHPQLRLAGGKKIHELLPDIDWNKGKCLRWLMRAMDMNSASWNPLYIGDDVTDEDAFREIREDGIGVIVAPASTDSQARYQLDDPDAVRLFLDRWTDHFARRSS